MGSLVRLAERIEWAQKEILSNTTKGDTIKPINDHLLAERILALVRYDRRFEGVDRSVLRHMTAYLLQRR